MTCDGETVYRWPESRAAVQTTEEKESAAAGLKTEEKGEGRQPAVTGSRGGLASRTEMAADGCSDVRLGLDGTERKREDGDGRRQLLCERMGRLTAVGCGRTGRRIGKMGGRLLGYRKEKKRKMREGLCARERER